MNYFVIAQGLLSREEIGSIPTDQDVNAVLEKLRYLGASETDLEAVRSQIEFNRGIIHVKGTGLASVENYPWLEDYRSKITWTNWNAYKSFLLYEGWPHSSLQSLGQDTDEILDRCGNPMDDNEWKVRGLVMGDVQSGKTANYAGLINKAVDAGYRYIVVLTGVIEQLRAQTQERLDLTFVGLSSQNQDNDASELSGVGRYKQPDVTRLTRVSSDFNQALVEGWIGLNAGVFYKPTHPFLIVTKKNKNNLVNIQRFLKQVLQGKSHFSSPLLLIDDEADNASVNVNSEDNPATINREIRSVLLLFERYSYVAYTATPFANIFIKPDLQAEFPDLFPSDFIYGIRPPSNYVGPHNVFGDDSESGDGYASQLVSIDDAAQIFPSKHSSSLTINVLPESLISAVDVFLVSCAIRDLRKEKLQHRTMLVNVSRFVRVQEEVRTRIERVVADRQLVIEQYGSSERFWSSGGEIAASIRTAWEEHYSDSGISWEAVRSQLAESVGRLKVVCVNQRSLQPLAYSRFPGKNGLRVIAVGGQALSRGLTLEGLCVSYFYRDSKAYDTLLQMGRWFGYRKGYEDLFRIWIDPQVNKWFEFIADVVKELRIDLHRMSLARSAPKDFGIRVRDHPDTLMITAANKMRAAQEITVRESFSGRLIETAYLSPDVHDNELNIDEINKFLGGLEHSSNLDSQSLTWKIDHRRLADLLSKLVFPLKNIEFIPLGEGLEAPMVDFIRRAPDPSLETWLLAFPQGSSENQSVKLILPADQEYIVKARKRQFEPITSKSFVELNRRRVGGMDDVYIGASKAESSRVKALLESKDESVKRRQILSGLNRPPLVVVSFIEPIAEPLPKLARRTKTRGRADPSEIGPKRLVALSIYFPSYSDAIGPVTYQLNQTAQRELCLIGGLEEDFDVDD